MKFEARIIDSILTVIKDNQHYLTKAENLPQLAKLGYMYNTLWYAGRTASYEGVLEKTVIVEDNETYECHQCEDNPKYKIEMCDPENGEIEDYIYDAWGMHVSNEFGPNWDEFSTIVLHGRPLSKLEQKLLKPQKTFDDWVDNLTDPEYQYSMLYPNRRAVANNLLCTIGTGYGYKDGFIMYEASGADQDSTDYGDWINAKFREDIQELVNQIMVDPEVELVIRTTEELKKKQKEKKEKEKKEERERLMRLLTKDMSSGEKERFENKLGDLFNDDEDITSMFKEEEEKYYPYYPICNYSIITKLDKDSHPSYINAAIEICEDILQHKEEEEEKRGKVNIKFAEGFLKKINNNWIEVTEEIILTEEQLNTKVYQLKSSLSVEGAPLIKSNRFTQEEYDSMKEKRTGHISHWDHLKKTNKVWTDSAIADQIMTMLNQNKVSEYNLGKFLKEYTSTLQFKDYDAELKQFKTDLYQLVAWDKLTPLDRNFWQNFGSAPSSMKHDHRNIGEVEKNNGAVGMDELFDDTFSMGYHLTYSVNNILHSFELLWKDKTKKHKI